MAFGGEKRRRARAWLALGLWVVLILVASGEPFSADATRGWLERAWLSLGLPPPGVGLQTAVRTSAHILEYAVLAVFGYRAFATQRAPRTAAFATLLLALGVAAADEWHQSRLATRTGSPRDVALDLAGAGLGLGLLAGARAVRERS